MAGWVCTLCLWFCTGIITSKDSRMAKCASAGFYSLIFLERNLNSREKGGRAPKAMNLCEVLGALV